MHARVGNPAVCTVVAGLIVDRAAATCVTVDLAAGYSGRNHGDVASIAERRRKLYVVLPISETIAERARALQARMAARGYHPAGRQGPMFEDMQRMPSVGIYRSVLQDRHLNVGTTWTANDLTDMVYLSAATGYADVVVAERHMTSMLGQAQRRLGRTLTVYPSLTQALPAIRGRIGSSEDAE